MTETIATDGTVWTRARRIGLVLLIAFVTFLLGLGIGKSGVNALQNAHRSLQKERERLTAEKIALQTENSRLSDELKSTQTKLAEFSSNVYEIEPNESKTVGPTDHLTIGFVGTPGNEKVELNINNERYSAAAGKVINIAIQQSVNCRVEVMSFNVIKARVVVKATCAEAKQ